MNRNPQIAGDTPWIRCDSHDESHHFGASLAFCNRLYERRRHRRTPRDSVDAALKAVQRARAAFAAALDGELELADELRRAQPNVH